MNKKFWNKYYEKHKKDKPSDFAVFAEKMFPRGTTIIDIGSGNNRDTDYFEENGHYVYPVDQVNGRTIEELIKTDRTANVLYMRWILHAIEPELQKELISWAKRHGRYIFIETRTDKDESFKEDHERHLVNPLSLIINLIGTRIVHMDQGTGFSKTKESDPHLVRVICETTPSS